MRIGVLALQGDFREHIKAVKEAGAEAVEVRNPEDFDNCDGLIIPGGESTTLSILIKKYSFGKKIRELAARGFPVFGTCAGAIVMAKEADGRPGVLGLMDLSVKRNAYGRQVESFESKIDLKNGKSVHGVFIRAPIITKTGPDALVLAKCNGNPVLVEQGNFLAATFHPELTKERGIHRIFVSIIKRAMGQK